MDRRQRLWLAAGLAVLLALGIVLAAIIAGSGRTPPGPPPSSPSPSRTATSTPSATPTPTPPPPPPPPTIPELPAAPMNILVIGSDSRVDARQQADTGVPSDQRSDCLMLIHVPADRHKIYGISIMRDLWVDIPGYGGSKVNASLQVGGIPLVVQTVESLLGTHVDHTVMLDFNGFRTLTDGLGGIDINVTIPFTASVDTHHEFVAGINHLDGQAALEFVRERYSFVDGDYQRVRNQQTFLRTLLAKLSGGIQTPAAVLALVSFAANDLTVDQGYDPAAVAILAYALRTVDPGASVFFTLPTAGAGTSSDGQSIILPDYAGIGEVAAALRDGTLPDYAAARGY